MNLAEEREARREASRRRKRYLMGDGVDWSELYRQNRIGGEEFYLRTGFFEHDLNYGGAAAHT